MTPEEIADLKWCATCLDNKPKSEFNKNHITRDGLMTRCKACYKAKKIERMAKGSLKLRKKLVPKLEKGYDQQPEKIKQIVELMYENPGITINEVSLATKLTPLTVTLYLSKNEFLRAVRLRGSRSLTKMIPRAVKSLEESLTAESEEVKLKAATKVLESEKILGPDRMDVTVNDLSNKTYEELDKIANNLRGSILKPVIEAEVIE